KGKAEGAGGKGVPTGAAGGKTPAIRDLEARLIRKLGTKCEVRDKNGKGEIAVAYSSLDELDRLLETLL
ncbi:MAG TPA: chromosome partitioning protein ParB, partial [Polyangiaceae bacterium]